MFNRLTEFFSGKRVLILGLGREGRSTLEILKKIPCVIGIADRQLNITEDLSDYELYGGENYLDCLESFDIIMKSPGIALLDKVSPDVKEKITGQTDLLLRFCENPIIGITGTKGKSTVSSLICHLLKKCGRDAVLVGNIGIPPLELADEFNDETIVVCEMSCHQLEYVKASPKTAVLLNIFEEHLDHYVDFAAYRAAKENIYRFQTESDLLIINKALLDKPVCAETITASLTEAADICLLGDKLRLDGVNIPFSDIHTSLLGRHNYYNIGVAMCAAAAYDCKTEDMLAALPDFHGLPHRLENVGTFGGVQYINDSISTCPSTAIAAVRSFDKVDTIIIGGMDRGIDYTELADFINLSNIEHVILLPDSGFRIEPMLNKSKRDVIKATDLEEAVRIAKSVTRVRCLLSPAAASYGFYKNFEERGEHFRRLVRS